MAPKKKIAIYSATGCRACENAVLDIHHCVSPLTQWAQVCFWPYMLGSQWEDLERTESIDVCFFAGSIRTEADREAALKLRGKSRLVAALGACAAYGGLPGLENLSDPSCAEGPETGPTPDANGPPLPRIEEKTLALSRVIDVDYFVPGCPPTLNFLWAAFQALVSTSRSQVRLSFSSLRLPEAMARAILSGVLPKKGSIFSGNLAVCASCSRTKDRKQFKYPLRPSQNSPDPSRCLLEQGYVCLGIVTREGCGGLCTAAGLACRGCFGKTDSVLDPGVKMVSSVGSILDSSNPEEIKEIVEAFVDLKGTFYRYTAASQCALLLPPKARR